MSADWTVRPIPPDVSLGPANTSTTPRISSDPYGTIDAMLPDDADRGFCEPHEPRRQGLAVALLLAIGAGGLLGVALARGGVRLGGAWGPM